MKIDYEQTRAGYHRGSYAASRDGREYNVSDARVGSTSQRFTQVVEVPERATNVKLQDSLPERYREARQDVR